MYIFCTFAPERVVCRVSFVHISFAWKGCRDRKASLPLSQTLDELHLRVEFTLINNCNPNDNYKKNIPPNFNGFYYIAFLFVHNRIDCKSLL